MERFFHKRVENDYSESRTLFSFFAREGRAKSHSHSGEGIFDADGWGEQIDKQGLQVSIPSWSPDLKPGEFWLWRY